MGVWYDYSYSKGGTLADGSTVPSAGGWAIGIGHTRQEWLGGYNRISLQYGVGNAANFSTGIDEPTVYLPNAHTFRFTDSAVIQPNNKLAVQPVFIYQSQTDGNPANGTNTWMSLGARPVWFFTDHVSLAFEAGFDHTSSGVGLYDGWLRKFTIAPQIGAGRKFFSRPVLRAFVTYANWSQGLEGFVGGPAFKTRPRDGTSACRAKRGGRRWLRRVVGLQRALDFQLGADVLDALDHQRSRAVLRGIEGRGDNELRQLVAQGVRLQAGGLLAVGERYGARPGVLLDELDFAAMSLQPLQRGFVDLLRVGLDDHGRNVVAALAIGALLLHVLDATGNGARYRDPLRLRGHRQSGEDSHGGMRFVAIAAC